MILLIKNATIPAESIIRSQPIQTGSLPIAVITITKAIKVIPKAIPLGDVPSLVKTYSTPAEMPIIMNMVRAIGVRKGIRKPKPICWN